MNGWHCSLWRFGGIDVLWGLVVFGSNLAADGHWSGVMLLGSGVMLLGSGLKLCDDDEY